MGTLTEEEMKDIFAQACEKYPQAQDYLNKGSFRMSTKGNIVCNYNGSDVVVSPVGQIIAGGGLAAIDRNVKKIERERQLALLFEKAERYVADPAFIKYLDHSEFVKEAHMLRSGKNCYVILTEKEDSPVRFKKNFPVSGDMSSSKKIADQVNKAGLVDKISDSRTGQLVRRAAKMVNDYYDNIRIGPDEQYIYNGLPKKETRKLRSWNSREIFEKEWKISHITNCYKNLEFVFCFATLRFTYNAEEDTLKIDSAEMALPKKISQIRKTKRTYTKIMNSIKAALPDEAIPEHAVTLTMTGDKGKPAYNVNLAFYGKDYKNTVALSKEATDKFKDDIKGTVKNAEKAYKEAQVSKKEQLEKQGLDGSILAKAICEVSSANSEFITENIICKILRGLKLNTERTYTLTGMAGKFNLIPEAEVKQVVRKLIKAGALKEWWVDGTYTDYYAIQPGNEACMGLIQNAAKSHYGKDKKFAEYTDTDWLLYFSETDPETLRDTYWTKLLPAFDHPAVYCINPELFTSFFSHAPKAFKEYLSAAVSVEEGSKQKLLRKVAAAVK